MNDEDLEQKIYLIKISMNGRINKKCEFEGLYFKKIIESIFEYYNNKYKSIGLTFERKRKELFLAMDNNDEKLENQIYLEMSKIQDKEEQMISKLKESVNYHLRL